MSKRNRLAMTKKFTTWALLHLCLLFSTPSCRREEPGGKTTTPEAENPQLPTKSKVESDTELEDYYIRIHSRRISEAQKILEEFRKGGGIEKRPVILSFGHFTHDEEDAQNLRKQLSEHYTVEISAANQDGIWLIKGTTDPEAIDVNKQEFLDWISFMANVSKSHGCVFSSWDIKDPISKQTWSNQEIETPFD